jgi:hypothetical protein
LVFNPFGCKKIIGRPQLRELIIDPFGEESMGIWLTVSMRSHALSILVLSVSVSSPSCAETSQFVSALIYQKYTCQQLAAEAQATALRAVRLARITPNEQMSKAAKATKDDETVVIQWPNLSSHALDKNLTGPIKDQMVSIEQASIEKQCSIQFQSQTR